MDALSLCCCYCNVEFAGNTKNINLRVGVDKANKQLKLVASICIVFLLTENTKRKEDKYIFTCKHTAITRITIRSLILKFYA